MFDLIADEILNAFAVKMKISDLQKQLDNKRTPKKYHSAIRSEIERYEKLLIEKQAIEKGK